MSLVWALFAFSMRVTSKTSLLPFLFSLAATLYLFIPQAPRSYSSLNKSPGMSPHTVRNLFLRFEMLLTRAHEPSFLRVASMFR